MKAYVRAQRLGGQEMFVPLRPSARRRPSRLREALVVIAGVECKAHYLVVDLPHSDDGFVQAFPAETTGVLRRAHDAAFGYFGGVPTLFRPRDLSARDGDYRARQAADLAA